MTNLETLPTIPVKGLNQEAYQEYQAQGLLHIPRPGHRDRILVGVHKSELIMESANKFLINRHGWHSHDLPPPKSRILTSGKSYQQLEADDFSLGRADDLRQEMFLNPADGIPPYDVIFAGQEKASSWQFDQQPHSQELFAFLPHQQTRDSNLMYPNRCSINILSLSQPLQLAELQTRITTNPRLRVITGLPGVAAQIGIPLEQVIKRTGAVEAGLRRAPEVIIAGIDVVETGSTVIANRLKHVPIFQIEQALPLTTPSGLERIVQANDTQGRFNRQYGRIIDDLTSHQ